MPYSPARPTMVEWKIERRTGSCRLCEREFEDGEQHLSTLNVDAGGLSRADVCRTCWDRAREEADGADQPLFWWSTTHLGDRKAALRLDLASLEELFVRLEGRQETAVRELRYVLCLLLMRKRRVKVEKIERDGEGEAFVVRRPRREERFRVWVFDFTAERIAELRSELQGIFDGAEGDDALQPQGPDGGPGSVPDGALPAGEHAHDDPTG